MTQEEWGESPLREVYRNYAMAEFLFGDPALSTWFTTVEREENERKQQMPICSTDGIPATVKTPNAL